MPACVRQHIVVREAQHDGEVFGDAEIPVQPGRQYFQIDKAGEHWESVKKSRSISFYIPPEFKNLKLELMGVKE